MSAKKYDMRSKKRKRFSEPVINYLEIERKYRAWILRRGLQNEMPEYNAMAKQSKREESE